jgi:PAS domain S-box-containing protein
MLPLAKHTSKGFSPSLRTLLIGLMAVQIGLPFGLVGWLSVYHGERSVQLLSQQSYHQAIHQIEHHLEDYFAIPPQLNQLNLAAESLGLLPIADFETLGHLFWKQMQLVDVSYVNYANEKGAFIGVERLADDSLLIHETPADNPNQFTTFETDAEGNRINGDSVFDDAPVQEEGWYADAADAGKPVWSEIYQWDDKPEILSISSSYPIYTDDGQMTGVIGVDLLLSDIGEFLKTVNISANSELYILERNGDVVASSTPESPFLVVEGQAQRLNAIATQDTRLRQAIETLEIQFGSLQALGATQTVEVRQNHTIIYEVPWHNEYGLDWLIIATVPEADFMAPIEASTQQTIALGLMVLVLTIWCASVATRWVAASLQHLDLAAAAIANGQFDTVYLTPSTHWVPIKIRELAGLHRSFRRMALKLQETFQQLAQINGELEARVQARTAALKHSEEKFAKAFNQSPIAIAISTLEDGRFIEANTACCQILEYPPCALIGKTSLELGLWHTPADYDRMVQDIRCHGYARLREVSFKTQTGRIICAEIAVSVIELDGQPRLLYVGNDVSDRKQAETQLVASLHEKEVLLKEIHHRVKNNLHVVVNLLDLQSDHVQDQTTLSVLRDSQSRLQTMALIHEQLYQSKDLQEIDFEAYLRRLVQNLLLSYGEAATHITLNLAIASVYLNIETAIPCGLLINELVTNALKHAFPEQTMGMIDIHLHSDPEGYLNLLIQDDGIGLDPDIFTTQTGSFGVKLIKILARQLKADMSIQSEPGTLFHLRFRELSYKPRVSGLTPSRGDSP